MADRAIDLFRRNLCSGLLTSILLRNNFIHDGTDIIQFQARRSGASERHLHVSQHGVQLLQIIRRLRRFARALFSQRLKHNRLHLIETLIPTPRDRTLLLLFRFIFIIGIALDC